MINEVVSQLRFISNTILQLLEHVNDEVLQERPIANKMSVWEVCVHLTQIPQADLLIQKGNSEQQMAHFYQTNMPDSIVNAKVQFTTGIQSLISYFEVQTDAELVSKFTTYWGSEYSSAEWFIQILNHLTHHRAQLHQYLLFLGQNVQVVLFR